MADPGAELTDQHRRAQARLAAEAALTAQEEWRQVSPTNLQETSSRWLAVTLHAQRQLRGRSRRLTAAYVRLLRALRLGSTLPPIPEGRPSADSAPPSLGQLRDDFAAACGQPRLRTVDDAVTVSVADDFAWPEPDEEADERRSVTSLVVTGPVQAQRGISRLQQAQQRGRLDDTDFLADLNAVMRDAGAQAAGAADRDAQMGGRDLLDSYARADRTVLGWARVTAPDPCWFCAMLASRGAVYRSAWTARYRGSGTRRRAVGSDLPQGWEDWSPDRLAEWEAARGVNRFHDNCHCTLIPVYSREDWIPPESQAFRELYYESTRGLSGPAARAAFRAAVEARRQRAAARGVSVR
ncbi:hypothetical protein ACFU98_35340 [Streptomyces sp. NPDC057575]|uniref:VG15 protein n=1 Tax=unclassified Streptomyces TaxID=2593676 RepID=UPI003679583F